MQLAAGAKLCACNIYISAELKTEVLDTLVTCIMLLCFFFSLADKHKMERFLRPDAPTVVSVYAPITFSPAGVLLFKQRNDGEGEENPV